MLIELSRQERVSKIHALATSAENRKYSEYFDYYNGDHFVKSNYYTTDYGKKSHFNVYTRSGLPIFDQKSDDDKITVKCNWCRVVVDTIADYTRGVNEDIQIVSDNQQDTLNEVWKKNKINVLTHEIAGEAGTFGKTYLKLRKRDKAAPVEVFNVDPGGVYLNQNPLTQDIDGAIYFFGISADYAKSLYPTIDFGGKSEVYYAEEWTKEKLHKFVDGVQVNEAGDLGVRDGNPYGFIPFYEIKADDYATSDISDVISLNDELNIILSYNNESIRYHAFPIYSPDGAFTGQNIIPMRSLKDVEISPKTILNFPAKRIESAGIPDSLNDYISKLHEQISIVSGVPLKLLTADLDGNLSGVALQRLMSGVIKKAEQRRNYIREAYLQINRDILILLGAGEAETDIIFPEIIKVDVSERLDEALKKQTLGISKETIFDELGYDFEEEDKKHQEEFENSLEKRLMDEQQDIQPNNKGFQKKGAKPPKGNAK